MAKPQRGLKVEKVCKCGKNFSPRLSEVKRGWGIFCSKSCKASHQNSRIGLPSLRVEDLMQSASDDIFYTGQGWG